MDKFSLKSEKEIKLMAEGGRRLSWIRNLLLRKIKPGVKTIEIERLAEKLIYKAGGRPSFKTVKNYQYAICICFNEEVVHGLPGQRVIQEGEVVGIDIGMIYKGFHTDTAWTILVGSEANETGDKIEGFLKVGEETLEKVIERIKVKSRIGHISQMIQGNIQKAGFSPVEVLTGHGVGRKLHEEPAIPQVLIGKIEDTPEIVPGMTLAIEIIYNMGSPEVVLKKDGWTIVTKDGKISAAFEKSIAVLKNGILVLTP